MNRKLSGFASMVLPVAAMLLLPLALAQRSFTSFPIAAMVATAEEMQIAISQGADVNERSTEDGVPMLSLAVWNNPDLRAIELMIEAGADVNMADNGGKTPLMYAADINDTTEKIELLLRYGADPSLEDASSLTALDYLATNPDLHETEAKAILEAAAAQLLPFAQGATIELSDGTAFVGNLTGTDLIFGTQHGDFSVEMDEIVSYDDSNLELSDGTRLAGAFTAGSWTVITNRGEFEFPAEQVSGLAAQAPAAVGTVNSVANSAGGPTESEARTAYQTALDNVFGAGTARITQFAKTDGLSSVRDGVDYYTLEFTATVSFPQGFNADCSPDHPKSGRLECMMVLANNQGRADRVGLGAHPYRNAGDVESTSHSVTFQRSEQGWRPR